MDSKTAKIASETLVDVSTPDDTVGVIASLSSRKGVKGATVDATYYADKWFPLSELNLSGESARIVVARYL